MFINLSQLLSGRTNKQCFDATVEVENDDDFSLQGVKKTAPINVSGEIVRSENKILLEATYDTEWKFQCGRCLCDVKRIISGSLNKEIVRNQVEDEYEEDDILIVKSEKIEISDLVLNEVVLNLPLQVICDEECEGLCPECGSNLNVNHCDCDIDTIDPRLEGLKKFFNKN